MPEHKAETRYSDRDTHDLLLLRSMYVKDGATHLRLLDGSEVILPHGRHRLTKAGWRQLAVKLHQQLVRVNPANCPPVSHKHDLENLHLHQVFYLGHPENDEALLRVAIVSLSGELLTLMGGLRAINIGLNIAMILASGSFPIRNREWKTVLT